MNEQNPIIERSFVVNLETRGLQSGMLVFNAPSKVNVKVRSSRSILGDINPDAITAYLNLDNMKVGQHSVTVACDFPKGEVLEISPKVVNLYIDVSKEKSFMAYLQKTGRTLKSGLFYFSIGRVTQTTCSDEVSP